MNDSAQQPGVAHRIDLANEPDFVIGGLQVSPALREVASSRGRHKVEPRVMQALVCLVHAQGAVLSRNTLIECCWRGRVVGDDAINRCIAKVRHLAAGPDHPHFVIETIPRVGYRLRASADDEVAPVPDAPDLRNDVGAQEITGETPARWRWKLFGAGLAGVLIAAFAAWRLWPAVPPAQWRIDGYRPLVATTMMERYPAISPDGALIAYTQGPHLYDRNIVIQKISGGEPLQFTQGPGDHLGPSWSDDGSRIAYVVGRKGEPCHIMVKPFPAGPAREVGRCATEERTTAHWLPHSNVLVFRDRPHAGALIRPMRLDVETGQKTELVHPSGNGEIVSACGSPDGKHTVLGRWAGDAHIELVLRDLETGRERVLLRGVDDRTDQIVRSLAWIDKDHLLISSFLHGEASLAVLNTGDGELRRLAFSGPSAIGNLAVGPKGLVAAAFDKPGGYLVGTSLRGTGDGFVTLHPNHEADSEPAFAPDGSLAVVSVRGGRKTLSVRKPGETFQLLYDFGSDSIKHPRWSHDGSRLAVVVSAGRQRGLAIIDRTGLRRAFVPLTAVMMGVPAWTAKDEALLLPLMDARGWRLWKISLTSPAKVAPFSDHGWMSVRTRGDAIYAMKDGSPGIWRYDGAESQKLADGPTGLNAGVWQIVGDRFLYGIMDGEATLKVFAVPIVGGQPTHLIDLADFKFEEQFAVDPRAETIVYSKMNRDSDIGLFRLVRDRAS